MYLPNSLSRALIIALAISTSAEAAEWSAEPRISLRTGFNDNIRLTSADHDSVWEAALSPAVKFGVAAENHGLSGDTGFAIRRFIGGSGQDSGDILNREDYHLNTNAYHQTERNRFDVDLKYTRDSTLDSELDAGVITNDLATRQRITLGPSWSRILNELTRITLDLQYSNVDYTDDPGLPDLVAYDYIVSSVSLLRQLTPRINGTLSASYASYKPDTDVDSDTLSLQAGISRNFSKTLVVSFLAGQRQTTSDRLIGTGFCIGAPAGASFPSCRLPGEPPGIPIPTGGTKGEFDTSGPVFSASIEKTLETGSLSASLSRTSSPGSNGELLDSTRLILSGAYKLSETLTSSLKVEYIENETIVSGIGLPTQDNETFLRVIPRVSWRWRREWELAGEYFYIDNDDPVTGTANRNAFYLALTYRMPKRSISR